jgi:5-methyltetrahydropteroyltriglutamate--homocysteine methyltransferase
MVRGLRTTQRATMEDATAVEVHLRAATHAIPLERLALRPRCGFASAEAGNPLTLEAQEVKRRLMGQIARQVWHM